MEPSAAILVIIGFLSLLVLALAIAVFLLNRKVDEMNKPKFGFLGKPLAVVAFVAVLASFGGATIISLDDGSTGLDDISVSSEFNLTADIILDELDTSRNQYRLNVVPSIDGEEWNGSDTQEFDVFWSVSSLTGGLQSFSETISQDNPGGVEVVLDDGENIVRASVRIEGLQIMVEERFVI